MWPMYSTAARGRGTTLLELMVSMAIMSLIFVSVGAILIKGMQYLRSNQNALDAQRGALLTMNKLAREVERTNTRFLYGQDGGISFADPFGGDENPALGITASFNSNAQGQLLFQRYICYYMNNATHTLSRREGPYNIFSGAAALTAPPPAGSQVCQTQGQPPLNVTWWIGETQRPARLIASDVSSFNVTSIDVNDANGVKVGALVNVALEMGDAARNDYNRFWFRVVTRFSPRNSD